MAVWYVFSGVLVLTISARVLRPLSGQRWFLLYNTVSVNTHVHVDQTSEVLPESHMLRLPDCVSQRRSCHSTNHSWQHCLAGGVRERPPPLDSSTRGLVRGYFCLDCRGPFKTVASGQDDWWTIWLTLKSYQTVCRGWSRSWLSSCPGGCVADCEADWMRRRTFGCPRCSHHK